MPYGKSMAHWKNDIRLKFFKKKIVALRLLYLVKKKFNHFLNMLSDFFFVQLKIWQCNYVTEEKEMIKD